MFLTPEQEIVANLSEGTHLVLAPPGTGKTDILSQRIKIAIDNGVDQKSMLCLTFTNRAAKEMNHRIQEKYGKSEIFIGNIHTFCLHFLKENHVLNNSNILLDEDESANVLQEAIQMYVDNEIATCKNRIVDIASFKRNLEKPIRDIKPYLLSQIICFINYSQKYKIPKELTFLKLPPKKNQPSQIQEITIENFFDEKFVSVLNKIASNYDFLKSNVNAVDFDDLLALTHNYLIENPIKNNLYKWLQIDEVQDLNPMQWHIINMIAEENAHKVYFGDYEQAIYSFLGAKFENLQNLEEKAQLHSFSQNFRSPQYILNLLVTYAKSELKPKWKRGPFSFSDEKPDKISLCFRHIEGTEEYESQFIVKKIIPNLPPEELKAILVRTNAQADIMASSLQSENYEIFKISGTDIFKYSIIKTTLAIMSVLVDRYSRSSWIRIFYELTNLKTLREARDFVVELFSNGFIPEDIIKGQFSILEDFHFGLENSRIVVFDTETTGLDTDNDDIIQIAAIEIINGKIGRTFEVFMDTDRDLTESEKIHHISKETLERYSIPAEIGLKQFLDFIGEDIVVAHNLPYDYSICKSNFERFGFSFNPKCNFYDTLDIAKRLYPDFPIYKLAYLIERLNVVGVNSHNALEDVKATANLIFKMFEETEILFEKRGVFLTDKKNIISFVVKNLQFIYSELEPYLKCEKSMSFLFSETMQMCHKIANFTKAQEYYKITNHMDHFIAPGNLKKNLEKHINDYNTYKEADLYTEKEKIVVSTIHKAKGLQFTNVIMPNCVDGNYPFIYSEDRSEDARLFYVGLSRSRKRLILSCSQLNSKKTIQIDDKFVNAPHKISPFIESIHSLLDYKYINLKDPKT